MKTEELAERAARGQASSDELEELAYRERSERERRQRPFMRPKKRKG